MKTFQKLREELNAPYEGIFASSYYRYLGLKDNLTQPVTILRALGIASLFKMPKPHIFKNDLIAGSLRHAHSDRDELSLTHAENFVSKLGARTFLTNKDHYSPNYRKVVKTGITGLIDEVENSLKVHASDSKKQETLNAMKITLTGFLEMIKNYARAAEEYKALEGYDSKKLDFIAKNCSALTLGAPKTFSEALQLVWMCHTAFCVEDRGAMALGRMDQYLYPFYKKDIQDGILTREFATELLENVFTKIPDTDVVNICVGGMDKQGNCMINELSYLILFAVKNCNAPGPNLSARITENTPDEFLDEALISIGTGLGYPALMNDHVNIEALKKYDYDEDDVYDYSMVGCIENFITGKQPPWSDGRFDTPRFFDYIFNNGKSKFNNSIGINTGELESITTMEEFLKAYEAQLIHGIDEYCFMFNAVNTSINQEYFEEPFLSCFCDDCIERGLDINNGGSKYPSVHGAAIMGIGTVCDSLAAIEKVVFCDKEATLYDIRDALNCNFAGYESLRRKLISAPKYGNDDNFVDKYAIWLVDFISSRFALHKTHDGGGIYIAMAANTQNVTAGKVIAATPDGRLEGEPLSDAASPTYGKDVSGVTSTLTSVSKPDYTKVACGTVVNQKFMPSAFEGENRKKLLALIRTYFKMGGQQVQINATSREILKDAMKNPEKYKNLVVRISGFSGYYTKQRREVQLDILNRTQHK